MKNIELVKLKALAMAATPQNLDSADTANRQDGCFYCPVCDGSGEIEAIHDYCNYDGVPLGVQFYGIGSEHVAAENYFRAATPAVVLALIEQLEAAEAGLKRRDAQEPVGWQFFDAGEWHAGSEKNNHRQNTEVAGYQVRNLYAAAPAAMLPPEMYWQDAPVSGATRSAAYSTGWNDCLEASKALGCQPAKQGYPDKLPCPVMLEPGLRFGKGIPTSTMLAAIQRRAEYYAELDAMTPEQRAEHDANIAGFRSMLPKQDDACQPDKVVKLPDAGDDSLLSTWQFKDAVINALDAAGVKWEESK